MKTIYLDQDQCAHFDLSYGPVAGGLGGVSPVPVPKSFIAADTLLKSKGRDGYDKDTVAWVKPLGGKTLILVQTGFGWFNVLGWISGRGVFTDFEGKVNPL